MQLSLPKGITASNMENANPLDKEKKEVADDVIESIYTDKDKQYINFLQQRLETAKRLRDQPYPEFGNKTFMQVYDENQVIANTILPSKTTEDDVIVSTGTVESKLHSLLSNVNNLNLSAEFLAYDQSNSKISELGVALTDIVHQTEEMDRADGAGDEEKRIQRQLELLKQPVVFVQEEWLTRWEIKKKLKAKYGGEFKNFEGWSEELVKVFEGPSRTLLHSPNVYLGNMFEFYMDNQPFVFCAVNEDYEVAKSKFGGFDNWEYVKKGPKGKLQQGQSVYSIFDNNWRLTDVQKDQVEVLYYYDKFRDEFQVIINGVLMFPIGFPLSAVSPRGEYNIAKQIYRIIHNKFAYGKSFISSGSVKEVAAILDEQIKLSVLKTRKSYAPPYVNTSGRVISKKVLSAGRISMGFNPDALKQIGEQGLGVTQGEVAMQQAMQDLVDRNTVSATFQGQASNPGSTATEIINMQKQAQLALGLTITVCTLLEKKLAYLRLWNVLENWFEPTDTQAIDVVDENPKPDTINDVRSMIVDKYRVTTRDTMIPGQGMGERKVIPMSTKQNKKSLPTPQEIRNEEYVAQDQKGVPVQHIYIDADAVKNAKLLWFAVVNPREKESSAMYKVEFRQMLVDIQAMMTFGAKPNVSALEDEFSRAYQKPRSKFFESPSSAAPAPEGEQGGAGAPPGIPNTEGMPTMTNSQLPASLMGAASG